MLIQLQFHPREVVVNPGSRQSSRVSAGDAICNNFHTYYSKYSVSSEGVRCLDL